MATSGEGGASKLPETAQNPPPKKIPQKILAPKIGPRQFLEASKSAACHLIIMLFWGVCAPDTTVGLTELFL